MPFRHAILIRAFFEIADTDADMENFQIADTDADTDIEIFQIADTDADTDMIFSKNRGHGHDADKPRTCVSTDLCLQLCFKRFRNYKYYCGSIISEWITTIRYCP